MVLVAAVVVHAREIEISNVEQTCPLNSFGEYPNCICTNGEPFNEAYNICPIQLLESLGLEGSCPYDSTGMKFRCFV